MLRRGTTACAFRVTEDTDVVLRLDSNPSTGFAWKVVATNRTFGYGTESYHPSMSGPVGSGGYQQFVWDTASGLRQIGRHTVELEYKRDGQSAEDTFGFTVEVVAK